MYIIRVNVILRHILWKNVDKVPPLYEMCILMLWMANARYCLHTKIQKLKKSSSRGQVITPLRKIKNMPRQNMYVNFRQCTFRTRLDADPL